MYIHVYIIHVCLNPGWKSRLYKVVEWYGKNEMIEDDRRYRKWWEMRTQVKIKEKGKNSEKNIWERAVGCVATVRGSSVISSLFLIIKITNLILNSHVCNTSRFKKKLTLKTPFPQNFFKIIKIIFKYIKFRKMNMLVDMRQ